MKSPLVLSLALSISIVGFTSNTVAADDLNPPAYRGLPGSTFSRWTYDAPPPNDEEFPRFDVPEDALFVSNPDFEDPDLVQEIYDDEFAEDFGPMEFGENFSWQLFAETAYSDDFMGRTGVLTDFFGGSWDVNNFFDSAPTKFLRLQLTWKPLDIDPTVFFFEVEYEDEDPTGGDEGFYFVEDERDPFENAVPLPDGWYHSTFDFEIEPNPFVEFLGLFPVGPRDADAPIAIDQAVIDTISIPEPSTFVLGGITLVARLGLWRRRRCFRDPYSI